MERELIYIVFNNETGVIEFETSNLDKAQDWIDEQDNAEEYLVLNEYQAAA